MMQLNKFLHNDELERRDAGFLAAVSKPSLSMIGISTACLAVGK
jgi:hypothetical protein